MSETIAAQLVELLSNANTTGVNDIVLTNCAVALSYLSAYAADAGQMVSLFDTFKGTTPISVGIKYGILTNGNETIDKTKMAKDLTTLLVDWLQRQSGFDSKVGD